MVLGMGIIIHIWHRTNLWSGVLLYLLWTQTVSEIVVYLYVIYRYLLFCVLLLWVYIPLKIYPIPLPHACMGEQLANAGNHINILYCTYEHRYETLIMKGTLMVNPDCVVKSWTLMSKVLIGDSHSQLPFTTSCTMSSTKWLHQLQDYS